MHFGQSSSPKDLIIYISLQLSKQQEKNLIPSFGQTPQGSIKHWLPLGRAITTSYLKQLH